MINKKTIVTASLPLIFLSGCLSPYNEQFSCNKGINSGACASVTQNYDDSFKRNSSTPLTKKQKEIFIDEIKNRDIIDDKLNLFGLRSDEVLDWTQLETLTYHQLKHLKEYYDFSNEDKKRINNLMNINLGAGINSTHKYKNFDLRNLLEATLIQNEELQGDKK